MLKESAGTSLEIQMFTACYRTFQMYQSEAIENFPKINGRYEL